MVHVICSVGRPSRATQRSASAHAAFAIMEAAKELKHPFRLAGFYNSG